MASNKPEQLPVLETRNELVLHEEGKTNYIDGFSTQLSATTLLPKVTSGTAEADCSNEQLLVPRPWFSPGEATNMCDGNPRCPSTTHRAWGITHRADWRRRRCSLLLLPSLSSTAQRRSQHSSTWLMADLVQEPRYLYPGPWPRWLQRPLVPTTSLLRRGEMGLTNGNHLEMTSHDWERARGGYTCQWIRAKARGWAANWPNFLFLSPFCVKNFQLDPQKT
jgi:hypothetical protein